jgi:hypothetical protein
VTGASLLTCRFVAVNYGHAFVPFV